MKEQKLMTFQTHLKEKMKNPEFAKGFEAEKKRLALALQIAELRQKQGYSQSKLANKAGITQQQLSKLERGDNCNMITFLKICDSLGLEVKLNL